MKKLFISTVSFLLIAFSLCGCGNNTKTSDTLEITEDMYITRIFDIYENPANYTEKAISIEGVFTANSHDSHKHYHVFRNVPIYDKDHGHDHMERLGFEFTYNGDMPQNNDWIEVVGILRPHDENGESSLVIEASSVTVLDKRGAETIKNTTATEHDGDSH